jgi:hypothetical protein
MKKLILLSFIILLAGNKAWSQKKLFNEIAQTDASAADQKEYKLYTSLKENPLIKDIRFIKVDVSALNDQSVNIDFKGSTVSARKNNIEMHGINSNYSWFGRLSDETGIFFTVINGQIASKFYIGNNPCLIVPYKDDVHLLITFSNEIDNGVCGTPHKSSVKIDDTIVPDDNDKNILSADDNCTMRVLWVVTAQAEPEIPMSLELAARMLQDESNLAYQQSLISYRMEIARVVRTNYVETTTNTTATAYGATSSYPSDLINMSTGAGLLNNIPTLRNLYNADVVVMVRSQATNSAQGFYGIAYGVPTGAQVLNPGNAFALISTEFMIGGRFTFAHEIGHIQGARHDNHAATPAYGRGYIFSTATSNNRTIMAVGGSCNPSTGCRVQFFSNPNVTFGGVPVGIADQRDNARRINETAIQMLAHRITSTNLLLPAETFDNGILARHLATQTISTNNNAVVLQSGSRVSMRAGSSIQLLPGFRASAGSTFTAYINTCSVVPLNAQLRTYNELNPSVQNRLRVEDSDEAIFKVYPNPTANTLNVKHPANSKILILYDVMGKQILQKTTSGSSLTELDLKGLPSGVYMLNIDGKKIIRVFRE